MKFLPWIFLMIGFSLYMFVGRGGPDAVKNESIQLVGSICMLVSIFMISKQMRQK
jgi:hypothetical protein